MPKSSTSTMPRISLLSEAKSINVNKWTYPGMQIYKIQEDIIDGLFRSLPTTTNNDVDIVFLKVSTLNLFYSTYMLATRQMANGIVSLNIDSKLKMGDISLVDEIATCTKRRNYSFATKYCACHEPNLYPIYDAIVGNYLAQVVESGHLPMYASYSKSAILNKMKNYSDYKELYDAFMDYYDLSSLSYREVDWYIWVANKCKTSAKLHSLNLFKLI